MTYIWYTIFSETLISEFKDFTALNLDYYELSSRIWIINKNLVDLFFLLIMHTQLMRFLLNGFSLMFFAACMIRLLI